MIVHLNNKLVSIMLLLIIAFSTIHTTISFSAETQAKALTKRQHAERELTKWKQSERNKWIEEYKFWNSKSSLTLGRAFELYNGSIKNNDILFYEIIEKRKPVAILTLINNEDATYSIQISKSFSSFFEKRLNDNYRIQLKNGLLYAINIKTNQTFVIQKMAQNGTYNPKDLITPMMRAETQTLKSLNVPKAMPYMKKLNVPIVNQGPYPWCWAASLTALVQYDLNAKETIYKITGNDPAKNGDVVKNIIPAFKTYGYMPSITPPLSIYDSKQLLNSNRPIFMLSQSAGNGHATLLCGYYTENEDTYYLMMDPNRREYVILLANDSTVHYYLGGELYTWKYTVQY